jgi:hypothetical protein
MRACLARRSPAACLGREWNAAQQLAKGMYAAPLAAWLAAYPRRELLVLTLEGLRCGAALGAGSLGCAHVSGQRPLLGACWHAGDCAAGRMCWGGMQGSAPQRRTCMQRRAAPARAPRNAWVSRASGAAQSSSACTSRVAPAE